MTRIFVAIDRPDAEGAAALVRQIAGQAGIKLGLEFFNASGPDAVRAVASGIPLFLDLKLHDIPNTVAGALRSVLSLRPRYITLHAAGGPAMLRAAAQAVASAGADRPRLLAVTVLTSMDDGDLQAVGQRGPVGDQVVRLARLARDCGIDGAICSPHEIAPLRAALGRDLVLMVPGIRPEWAAGAGDQKRVMTPREAIQAGADHLVIGRPITAASDPKAALQRITDELDWPPKSKSAA